jgi:hypothetical protein
VRAFLSFKHEEADEEIADFLCRALRCRFNIQLVRLKDEPPVAGDLTSTTLDSRIDSCTSLVTIWSDRSKNSKWVPYERHRATVERGFRECLIQFPATDPPCDLVRTEDGGLDTHVVKLKGVTLVRKYPGGPTRARFDTSFDTVILTVRDAVLERARAKK